jgi:hypothetical protein
MANHAHSTRTSLLPRSCSPQTLFGLGLGRQLGPVTVAIAAMRSADPDLDRQRLRELRRRIADRIEADIALLDALDGDPDQEDENEHGGDVQDEPHDADQDERDTAFEWPGRGVHAFTVGGLCS